MKRLLQFVFCSSLFVKGYGRLILEPHPFSVS